MTSTEVLPRTVDIVPSVLSGQRGQADRQPVDYATNAGATEISRTAICCPRWPVSNVLTEGKPDCHLLCSQLGCSTSQYCDLRRDNKAKLRTMQSLITKHVRMPIQSSFVCECACACVHHQCNLAPLAFTLHCDYATGWTHSTVAMLQAELPYWF